jgi:hypothetical protein
MLTSSEFREHSPDAILVAEEGWLVPRSLVSIDSFLTPAECRYFEGGVFTRGDDLSHAYRTTESASDPSELAITAAGAQIPVIGELDWQLEELLRGELAVKTLSMSSQLRVSLPGSLGHPRHVDTKDLLVETPTGAFSSISVSLPLSWNDGVCPRFTLYTERMEERVDTPGTLTLFSPVLEHENGPHGGTRPYVWYIGTAQIECLRSGEAGPSEAIQ